MRKRHVWAMVSLAVLCAQSLRRLFPAWLVFCILENLALCMQVSQDSELSTPAPPPPKKKYLRKKKKEKEN